MVRARLAAGQEVCTGYAVSRSLLTGCRGGVPDTHTAARQLIKDYVDGKLRFCHLPPGQGALCPGVNASLMSAASQAAQAALATGAATLPASGSASAGIEVSDAAIGAGDKDVRLALQGAREKIVFQMDSTVGGEAGVAVGQTNAARKGRANRALSAGVWADADEATLLKVGWPSLAGALAAAGVAPEAAGGWLLGVLMLGARETSLRRSSDEAWECAARERRCRQVGRQKTGRQETRRRSVCGARGPALQRRAGACLPVCLLARSLDARQHAAERRACASAPKSG